MCVIQLVTNSFKHPYGTPPVDIPANPIRLENAEISSIELKYGIPLTSRAIQKDESYNEAKHDEVRLHLKHLDGKYYRTKILQCRCMIMAVNYANKSPDEQQML